MYMCDLKINFTECVHKQRLVGLISVEVKPSVQPIGAFLQTSMYEKGIYMNR